MFYKIDDKIAIVSIVGPFAISIPLGNFQHNLVLSNYWFSFLNNQICASPSM